MVPPPRSLGRLVSTGALGLVLAAGGSGGCGDDSGDPTRDDGPVPIGDTGGEPEGDTTGEVYVPSEEATDLCVLAPSIGAGRHHGSVRGHTSELDGACGLDGPDAFFRLEVPRRSDVWLQGLGIGFTPRVGVLPHTCTTDWTHRTMACTEGVGTWLVDVPAGASVVVSVGLDPDHPALGQPPPMEGPDPLEFVLDVELRNVLGEGEPCEPVGVGRCAAGTACLPPPPPDDPESPPGAAICTVLEGDTCQTAVTLPVPLMGSTTVEIDPAQPQSDAHAHSCDGARSRERVLRLALPQSGLHDLVLRTDHPEVGLAVRAPGCLPADERGCIDPAGASAGPLLAQIDGNEAFVFVELPPAAGSDPDEPTGDGGTMGEEAPILVEIERFDSSSFD